MIELATELKFLRGVELFSNIREEVLAKLASETHLSTCPGVI